MLQRFWGVTGTLSLLSLGQKFRVTYMVTNLKAITGASPRHWSFGLGLTWGLRCLSISGRHHPDENQCEARKPLAGSGS